MKKSLPLAALVLTLAMPALQGCFPAVVAGAAVGVMSVHDRRSTGTQADDETTEWKARSRVPEASFKTSHINFTSYNRRLLITGEVPSQEVRALIESEVRSIEGVRDVFNELAIGNASSLGSRTTDSVIDSKVKARLVDSNQVSANHIKVVTERANTYLMGIVNEREAKVAIQIARTTSGVRKVVNLLEIVPEAETRRIDSEITRGGNAASATAPVETR